MASGLQGRKAGFIKLSKIKFKYILQKNEIMKILNPSQFMKRGRSNKMFFQIRKSTIAFNRCASDLFKKDKCCLGEQNGNIYIKPDEKGFDVKFNKHNCAAIYNTSLCDYLLKKYGDGKFIITEGNNKGWHKVEKANR